MKRKYYLGLGIIIVQLVLALLIGWGLADDVKIPTHWNIRGEVDGWTGKWNGIFLFPGINLVLLLLLVTMPRYSVRYRSASERFKKLLPDISIIMVLFFALIHLFSLLQAAGKIPLDFKPVLMLVGLLFIFLGNLLPKVPSNFFLGIRTPWTLSSELNWRKTHRLGGVCFVLAGFLMIIIPLLTGDKILANTLTFSAMMVLVLFPVLYSFIFFLRKEK